MVRFGLVGSADIIGILKGGTFLAIEVKTGKARQSKQQLAFQKMITDFGGHYLVARSVDDVLAFLQTVGKKFLELGGK